MHIKKGEANVHQNCDVMIDQIRAISNKRLVKKLGELPKKVSGACKRVFNDRHRSAIRLKIPIPATGPNK